MFLSLIVASQIAVAAEKRTLSVAEQTIIKNAIGAKLLDAESARYQLPPIVAKSRVYCGKVNAKNSFGGYVGFRVFSVNLDKTSADRIESIFYTKIETENDPAGVKRNCIIDGYILD